jgi:magnesium chelatase accessory protein
VGRGDPGSATPTRAGRATLDWNIDGRDWPNRGASQFVEAGGLRWHVQISGRGPVALLLHGTGASTHSWRELSPLLAKRFTVVAPDLPGHGFTGRPAATGLSLPCIAEGVRELLAALNRSPVLGIGHSAGAAILARMCIDKALDLRALISLNGAFLPFRGLPGAVFSPFAKLLAATPWVPQLLAWRAADRAAVQRLIDSTGSRLDPVGVDGYARLVRDPSHVAGVLGMMAAWDLAALERDLTRLDVPVALLVGGRDRTVSPVEAQVVAERLPRAEVQRMPAYGHLMHEEAPAEVAAAVVDFARRHGVLRR